MKKIILILLALTLIVGCGQTYNVDYTVRVVYNNGDIDTLNINYSGKSENPFSLSPLDSSLFGGSSSHCLKTRRNMSVNNNIFTIVCDVRRYEILKSVNRKIK